MWAPILNTVWSLDTVSKRIYRINKKKNTEEGCEDDHRNEMLFRQRKVRQKDSSAWKIDD